jgi:quercetin dioxygenase-like cupin family protein
VSDRTTSPPPAGSHPGDGTPWHFHSAVKDTVFCLEEGLEVWLRDPEQRVALRPGERQDIAPRRVDRVVNATARPLRYLLVQATGPYDLNEVT